MALARLGSTGGGGGGTSCSIFVGNVPYDAQEDEMKELFSKVGNVASVRVVCDKDTKQPRGYAFIDYGDSACVQMAIEKLNNVEYNGRKLRVDWAERELRASFSSRGDHGDDGGGPGGGPGGGGHRHHGGGAAAPSSHHHRRGPPIMPVSDPLPPVPVPTVADRLAKLREAEEAEKAKIAAAENAERAEVGRLMETMTPQQVIHILSEMQRLSLRAPEVARTLLAENMQLALAVEHAQFLAGILEETPLPTAPEVKERARNTREKLWGSTAAPGTLQSGAGGGVPSPPAHSGGGLVGLPGAAPPNVAAQMMGAAVVPFAAAAAGGGVGASPLAAAAQGLPQLLGAAAADPASRAQLVARLGQLSPAEIDKLPHDHKVQLLGFLQNLPPRQ